MKLLKQGKYKYNQDNLLGEGSFGKVYYGYNNYNETKIAIKAIDITKIQTGEETLKQILFSQITVMRKFNKKMYETPCPYLVRQEDVFRTDRNICIVMEICEAGTLEDQMRVKRFKENQCIEVLYCIAKGLGYMAEMGIVHRDLKPENIFVSTTKDQEGEKLYYKIGDFGFAEQKQEFQIVMGTFPYMAPEMFKKQKYDNKVDVWSLGIIAYEIMFGGLYFVGKDKFEIQKNIKQKPFVLSPKQKIKTSPHYQDFITRCLNKDPQARLEVLKLLDHPLFNIIKQQMTHLQQTIAKNQLPVQAPLSLVKIQTKTEEVIFTQLTNQIEKVEEHNLKPANKVSTFEKLNHLLVQIIKMRECAERFHQFQMESKRCTQFIQMYLLKDGVAMMSRLIYSVANKQNHVQLQQSEFIELSLEKNVSQVQELTQKCIKQYQWISGLYSIKYKWFIQQFLPNFTEDQQNLIKVVVKQEPYEMITRLVFQKQLRKWKSVLDDSPKRYKKWIDLHKECQRMLQLKVYG